MTLDVQKIIERGSIFTTGDPTAPGVGRYQGNGRFGGVYSRLGLHAHPDEQTAFDRHGATQLTHLQHWGRFAFTSPNTHGQTTADYLLPLLRIFWEQPAHPVSDYQQVQSFYDATITTHFRTSEGTEVDVTTWFDPVRRNLAGIEIETNGVVSPILLVAAWDFVPYRYAYTTLTRQECAVEKIGDQWRLTVTCPTTTNRLTSEIFVHSNAAIEPCPAGIRLRPGAGLTRLFVSFGDPVDLNETAASLDRTRAHWHDLWVHSALFDLPDERSQQLWVRSVAYVLSSFNDDGLGFTPTNGLTGNTFPFNFVQDLCYVHPLLLAHGQLRVVQSWVERLSGWLPEMKAYAQRLWPEVRGIYPPWELPFGPMTGYHQPGVPIAYCYEPHNAGYLARIVYDTGVMVDDPAWTETHVRPLLREIASFYHSFCRKEADGRWHLALLPAIGQDEAGGRNQRDYLCSLYSAQYTFQRAIEHGLDVTGDYRRILDEGLAFESLRSERGFFYASAGSGPQDFGQQKHPVQLNGLAYQRVADAPRREELRAHSLRYETTKRALEPFFYGWTLGEFLVASAHLGDVAGWQRDWSQLRPSNYTDADWVQIYETSGTTTQPFYITTHGLVAQSLEAMIISDYWGRLIVATQSPWTEPVRFRNFRSVLGVSVDGEITDHAVVTLTAWKTCQLAVNGVVVALDAGATRMLVLRRNANRT